MPNWDDMVSTKPTELAVNLRSSRTVPEPRSSPAVRAKQISGGMAVNPRPQSIQTHPLVECSERSEECIETQDGNRILPTQVSFHTRLLL